MNAKIVLVKDFKRPAIKDIQAVEETVKAILNDIQAKGDTAINHWSEKIDGHKVNIIKLLSFDQYNLDTDLARAIKTAHNRIKRFCEFQKKDLKNATFTDDFGTFGYIYQPIERIGAYIPGGNFPLISTALMTLTPAFVAGCPVRIACSPSKNPALLAAASLAGATTFLQLGGAQAIGAMSYGFDKIDSVNMIVGPGNAYVNMAKSQVQFRTKIDTLAGPSELLVYANELQNPEWIVLDTLAQAEHDAHAISLIVSTSNQLLENLYSCTMAYDSGAALIKNKQIVFIKAENKDQAIRFINDYAPEHLMVCDVESDTSLFTNYGSLFIGENSAVAFGDYCAGPNHTLPTNGVAKNSGGLSIHQFLKVFSTQEISDVGRIELAKTSSVLAKAEGLIYHQLSAEVRN